ncbi:hypothetical protein DFH07DRAFT_949385 [Mycena maculata]|uniref:Uncharacterized protein n=1 Tax=Mycena maculata TaxID=230809 RepID=A0AAD7KDW8_9AGAR|nr:hypothetical protein DFH07DRAFT_949385 [Mycena maculata]
MGKSQKPTSSKKQKQKVNFGANGRTTGKGKGKRNSSPDVTSTSSRKKARTDEEPPTAGASGSTGAASGNAPPTAGADAAGNTSGNKGPADTASAQKRVRNPWGIRPKEVPEAAKSTQRAFQRFIRGLCGLLSQSDTLPSAVGARTHYEKRFDKVDDFRAHMRNLIDESRTAITAATALATNLVEKAKRIPGPIANDIARIPGQHLATVFTMILKAGLQGFCPDVEGPVQSEYNQLHRHLAVSGFQFLAGSLALAALEVNVQISKDIGLLNDMFDHYVYGTLAQRTRMETRRPGSLSQSIQHTVEYKGRTRLAEIRFKTASRLKLRKPVLRMAFIKEAHSDDEHTTTGRCVRRKPGRNPVVAKFFRNELDVAAEEYRKRNAKQGQRPPKPRTRPNPLLPASEIGMTLPPDVPIDFFTPEYYNALTVKERARYANTGVAFPLEDFAFDPAHEDWKTMGKQEFMEMYGDDVLDQYDIPSAEEIDALSDSDADDEEEEEIDLEDTDDEEGDEMEVDEDLRPE